MKTDGRKEGGSGQKCDTRCASGKEEFVNATRRKWERGEGREKICREKQRRGGFSLPSKVTLSKRERGTVHNPFPRFICSS